MFGSSRRQSREQKYDVPVWAPEFAEGAEYSGGKSRLHRVSSKT